MDYSTCTYSSPGCQHASVCGLLSRQSYKHARSGTWAARMVDEQRPLADRVRSALQLFG